MCLWGIQSQTNETGVCVDDGGESMLRSCPTEGVNVSMDSREGFIFLSNEEKEDFFLGWQVFKEASFQH